MLNKEWDIVLKDELNKEYFQTLLNKIKEEYKNKNIFPKEENIFRIFKEVDYNQIKVVILGQDPYHGENEADGRAFSVPNQIKTPPSLRNIFKELENDLNIKKEENDLTNWTKQGVFLLNTILTVEKDKPLSHKNIGWEIFTDEVIKKISDRENPVIFILFGKYAQSKKKIISKKHYIIETPHPSPLSVYRGFFGSKIFSRANEILDKNKIEW